MGKYKVEFDFQDEMEIEADDEDEAIENFCLKYEDVLARNNETMQNRVWDTIKVKKI